MHAVVTQVVGELWAADPSSVPGSAKQNANPGEQSEAPRPGWKPGQEQNPGPENQDSQHMLEQPRWYFLDSRTSQLLGRQQLGYGMVVDGFAKFQALHFGISGPEISEGFSF